MFKRAVGHAVKTAVHVGRAASMASTAAIGGLAIHKAIKYRSSPDALAIHGAAHFVHSGNAFKANNVPKMLYHDHHALAAGMAHRALGVGTKIKNAMGSVPKPPPAI